MKSSQEMYDAGYAIPQYDITISAMTLCKSVPSSAYLLLGLGGILATRATEPGQLITLLAVLPPTILECCI
jgi:hypothetical protein